MKQHLKALFLSTLVLASVHAQAAQIIVPPTGVDSDAPGAMNIIITGDIVETDSDDFRFKTANIKTGAVWLNSNGGNMKAAIAIGTEIRMRQFNTVVAGNLTCASACGLIWLGGVKRYAAATSHIGFHSISVMEGNQRVESSDGNAVTGAYLILQGARPCRSPRRNLNAVRKILAMSTG